MDRPAETGPHDLAPLARRLAEICDAQPFETSFEMLENATGARIGREATRPTPSASTRKILFMAAALAAVKEGRLDLMQPMTMTAEHQGGPVSGLCAFLTPGLTMPLRDAIVLMIVISDNVGTSLVGEATGLDAINAYARRIGMEGTTIRGIVQPRDMPEWSDFDFVAETTAADQVHLLAALLDGCDSEAAAARIGLDPALCRLAIDILGWQRLRERIPGLLPTGTRVANKTGTGTYGVMDAGIVFDGGRPLYTLAVFTRAIPWERPDGLPGHAMANRAVAELSRACWDHLRDGDGRDVR
ncbi:serine hydrolase [Acuticoccus kandeliae]|uniref:serine hydrolase n=1 Tax=Acuticoccus kandeliae TaxID=2073160 RepID=UPI001300507A|nr:serine hydrolase [Acuticoccus kandeliae]